MHTKPASASEAIELGTGNVFADLDLSDATELHLRVQLATRLNDLIQAEGLTQATTAKHLGIAQPQVSELKNYKLTSFSSERLLHLHHPEEPGCRNLHPSPRSLACAGHDCGRYDGVGCGVASHGNALVTLDALFSSLQQRAVAGQL